MTLRQVDADFIPEDQHLLHEEMKEHPFPEQTKAWSFPVSRNWSLIDRAGSVCFFCKLRHWPWRVKHAICSIQ
jgi:hypothetical protein